MASPKKQSQRCWGLLRSRQCWLPTWRGWAVLLLTVAALALLAGTQVYPFLAPTHPIYSGALVVEGWAPDYALKEALNEFNQHPYTKLYVTGGPLEKGAYLADYKTHAELGTAILLRLGLNSNAVQTVPAPETFRNRTFASAVALRQWLDQHQIPTRNFHVMTVGPHARRTWLLFQMALGKDANVGITAIKERGYDPAHWWQTSEGVRTVIDETIAYGYARLLFHP